MSNDSKGIVMKAMRVILIGFIFLASLGFACNETDASGKTHIVEIKDFSFVPKVLNLSKGDKVVWINRDTIEHNIVDSSSQETLSQTLAKDDKFSYIVKQEMNYECGFHPSMTGVVHLNGQ